MKGEKGERGEREGKEGENLGYKEGRHVKFPVIRDCNSTNLSPTAEKAREILTEVKEAQETFKKQRETIKLEAEVLCRYVNTVEHHLSELQTSNCALRVANLYRR